MLRESGGNLIARNVIAGNAGSGVGIHGGVSNVVSGNLIGTNAAGTAAIPNAGGGIFVSGGASHRIGGAAAGEGNVVSGNGATGIYIQNVTGVAVLGNHVGVDATGLKPLGNAGNGIQLVDSSKNTIGGSAPGDRNVISSNNGEGLRIDGALSAGNHVRGNYVGLSAAGTADFGNAASGIYIRRAPANVVEYNLVSGNNGFAGIAVCGTAAFCGGGDVGTPGSTAGGNVIRHNSVGVDATGEHALGNSGYGVSIDGAPNTAIGGVGQGNVITASGNAGVVLFAGATGTVVSSNTITRNLIGVFVDGAASVANRITRNNTSDNTQLNIDLAPAGPTPNDPFDRDSGPNTLQNFPVLDRAAFVGEGSVRVAGTIDTAPNTTVLIEIFLSAGGCDGGGGGPAALSIIGETTLVTGEGGSRSFVVDIAGVSPGAGITATATSESEGGAGNTSEISACVVAAPQFYDYRLRPELVVVPVRKPGY
jgi:hypothetical protein